MKTFLILKQNTILEIAQLCPKQMPNVSFITAEDFFLDQEISGKII